MIIKGGLMSITIDGVKHEFSSCAEMSLEPKREEPFRDTMRDMASAEFTATCTSMRWKGPFKYVYSKKRRTREKYKKKIAKFLGLPYINPKRIKEVPCIYIGADDDNQNK